MNPRTQIAVELMKANLHRSVPMSELARSMKTSQSHLCYLFKTEIGLSPERYFLKLKLEEASELLTTTLLSIKEIMIEVGFNDRSNFARRFRKAYGLTPSQYRERHLDIERATKSVFEHPSKGGGKS